jgi:hypothetical protein
MASDDTGEDVDEGCGRGTGRPTTRTRKGRALTETSEDHTPTAELAASMQLSRSRHGSVEPMY